MGLIDANALKKAIIKRLAVSDEKYLLPSERTIWEEINSAIEDALTIEPDTDTISRPKGQWMPETMSEIVECDLGDNDSVVGHYCSVCNKDAYTNNCGDELLTDFCPNCGADMRP